MSRAASIVTALSRLGRDAACGFTGSRGSTLPDASILLFSRVSVLEAGTVIGAFGRAITFSTNTDVPGPNPSVYAFVKISTQRNIYRVPIR